MDPRGRPGEQGPLEYTWSRPHGQERPHTQPWPAQLLPEETSGEAAGGVRGRGKVWGPLPRKCRIPAPYLRLGPHERKSHAALEEVRLQQFTGNAHFLLKEKNTDRWAGRTRTGDASGLREAGKTLADTVVFRSQTAAAAGCGGTSPRPPLAAPFLWFPADRCRKQSHSSFLASTWALHPHALPVNWTGQARSGHLLRFGLQGNQVVLLAPFAQFHTLILPFKTSPV